MRHRRVFTLDLIECCVGDLDQSVLDVPVVLQEFVLQSQKTQQQVAGIERRVEQWIVVQFVQCKSRDPLRANALT